MEFPSACRMNAGSISLQNTLNSWECVNKFFKRLQSQQVYTRAEKESYLLFEKLKRENG